MLRGLFTLGFTLVQTWGAIVLMGAGLEGPFRWALVVVLSAACIAVLDSWKELRAITRIAERPRTDCAEQPAARTAQTGGFPFPTEDSTGNG